MYKYISTFCGVNRLPMYFSWRKRVVSIIRRSIVKVFGAESKNKYYNFYAVYII